MSLLTCLGFVENQILRYTLVYSIKVRHCECAAYNYYNTYDSLSLAVHVSDFIIFMRALVHDYN